MKKILFAIFFLTVRFAISQSGYPTKEAIDKDTICAITLDQVDSINVSFVRLDECLDINNAYNDEIIRLNQVIVDYDNISNAQDQKIVLQNSIIQEQSGQVAIDDKQIKKNARHIKWLKFQRNALVVGVAVLVGYIAIHR